MPGSHIEYSMLYLEARTAKEWGLTPSQWAKEPRWSRAVMVAQVETEGRIEFWLMEDSKRESKG